MGQRQSRRQVVVSRALFATLCLAIVASCGDKPAVQEPTPLQSEEGSSQVPSEQEAADTEAVQIKAISDAINANASGVYQCWAKTIANDVRVEGKVVLRVALPGEGPAKVALVDNQTGDAILEACLVELWSQYSWPPVFAAGDEIVLPPFDFVAPDAQYSVSTGHTQVQSLFDGQLQIRVLADQKNTGNTDASLSLIRAQPGLEIPLHSHTSAELVFVLSGSSVLRVAGGETELGEGSAVYIPKGVPHGFQYQGEEPSELVQLYAPGGPEAFYRDQSELAGTVAFKGTLPQKGPRAIVRNIAAIAPVSIMAGQGEVLKIFEPAVSKDKAAYLGALRAQPGASAPSYRNVDSTELLYILEGQSEMSIEGTTLRVQAGDVVQIPKGAQHSRTITGDVTFKALQFYTPARPEQRFKGKK